MTRIRETIFRGTYSNVIYTLDGRFEMYKGIDWPKYNSGNEEYTDLISFSALKYFVIRDLERINGDFSIGKMLKTMILEPGFNYIFWMRVTRFFYLRNNKVLFLITNIIRRHYSLKFGYQISYRSQILPGFAIAHWGYILIQGKTKIGSNCYVRPGVIMGKKSVYQDAFQTVGDNVEFGAGVILAGTLDIGDYVTIGANSVVLNDIPSNSTAVGVPARVVRNYGGFH